MDGCRNTRRTCLKSLRTADLATVIGDSSVIGHVLRFERAHPKAPTRIGPAQSGHQQGFPDIGTGTLQHQGGNGLHTHSGFKTFFQMIKPDQNSTPICALMPCSRNGCLTIVISVTRSAASIKVSGALRPVRTMC